MINSKIKFPNPTVPSTYLSNIAVKAMNDTKGERNIVPSRLFFSVLPRLSILNFNFSLFEHRNRLGSIRTAQAKMNTIAAEKRIFEALPGNVPSFYRPLFYNWAKKILRTRNKKRNPLDHFW